MDYSKLKETDVKPVKDIIDFLERNQLEITLMGSAKRGTRDYNDIDLLALGSATAIRNVVLGLNYLNLPKDVQQTFDRFTFIGLEDFDIEFKGGSTGYEETTVDYRYKIYKGSTEIDLCLIDTTKRKTLPKIIRYT